MMPCHVSLTIPTRLCSWSKNGGLFTPLHSARTLHLASKTLAFGLRIAAKTYRVRPACHLLRTQLPCDVGPGNALLEPRQVKRTEHDSLLGSDLLSFQRNPCSRTNLLLACWFLVEDDGL
jgi:hypothetical protein